MADLVSLKNQKKVIKSNLTRFKNYFDSIKSQECDEKTLEYDLEKIEPSWDSYNDTQSKIEILEQIDIDESDRDMFEGCYFLVVSEVKTFIKNYDDRVKESDEVSMLSSNHSGDFCLNNVNESNSLVRLPPIKLPTFDGKYR